MDLVGYASPFLLLGIKEFTDEFLELAFALGELGGAQDDALLEGAVEMPDVLFGVLLVRDVLDLGDEVEGVAR